MKNFGYQNFHASLSDSTQLLTILIGIWNTDWAVGPRHNLNNASFSNAVDLLAPLHIPEKASFVFSYSHDPATQLQPWTTFFLLLSLLFYLIWKFLKKKKEIPLKSWSINKIPALKKPPLWKSKAKILTFV